MSTLDEFKQVMGRLSRVELDEISAWLHRLTTRNDYVAETAANYHTSPAYGRFSVEEYLRLEEESQMRHEYIHGALYAMSGATIQHSLICGNLFAALHAHVRGGPCQVHMADFKVRLEINQHDLFYYPDVMVACAHSGVEKYYLRYPRLIIEVLSPSTETIDRREKRFNYAQISSLEEYVLVSQASAELTIYRRDNDWAPQVVRGHEASAALLSVGFSLSLARVYADVPL